VTSTEQPNICIIGGGAAGIAAAYFLNQQGYKKVTLLEKANRIGGKCMSLTFGGKSFDLGANYVTSDYKIVRQLAKQVKADLYTEGKLNAFDMQENSIASLLKAILKNASFWKIGWQSARFIWKRWRVRHVISHHKPGYKGIAAHPDLCQPFENWLQQNGLSALCPLFEVPISLMGYGQLSQVSTAYALTYLSIHTFLDLSLAAVNPHLRGYPKRFTEGYQRFLERIAWKLDNIEVDATVTSVTRGKQIEVKYQTTCGTTTATLQCDFLIVAVPLYLEAMQPFMKDLTVTEKALFSQVIYDPFIVTTYNMPQLNAFTAATFMLPEPEEGEPFVVTRQFPDNDLISIYTRAEFGKTIDKTLLLAKNAAFVKRATGLDLCDYHTYNEFPYFPHVTPTAMANGFYDELEAIQGQNNTFYVGGLMNFELVETIMNYTKHLIEQRFPKKLN
jgi:Flavin containing amine oxidoreductase